MESIKGVSILYQYFSKTKQSVVAQVLTHLYLQTVTATKVHITKILLVCATYCCIHILSLSSSDYYVVVLLDTYALYV